MFDTNSPIGQAFDQSKKIGTDVVQNTVKTVKNQVFEDESSPDNSSPQKQMQPQKTDTSNLEVEDRTKEVVKDFYSTSGNDTAASSQPQTDQERLAKTRAELQKFQNQHKETYYDPLFAYENKKPEQTKVEEKEQEEEQKMQELEVKQQKKDQDISVQMHQQTTEKFRGAMG